MGNSINNNLPRNENLKQKAKDLRKSGNLSEALLWLKINKGQIGGLDFDRQVIIGNYIVDFFCTKKMFVIEIDGESHDFKGDYDEKRNSFLEGLGLNVMHISDKDVKNNLAGVLESIKERLKI